MAGFQVLAGRRQVSPETVERFRGLPVANISDCMARMTAGGPALRPMQAGGYLCGPAITVKTRPGDNLMVHKALVMAQPGDVIVVDGGGDLTNALIGELMVAYAVTRRLGGFVINGAVRDCAALRTVTLPVYAAGITHRGPYKDGPGEVNVPVAIGGMVVNPGDLIVGDDDGLLCVPIDEAEAIHALTREKMASEAVTIENIRNGSHDVAWIDAKLRSAGCPLPG